MENRGMQTSDFSKEIIAAYEKARRLLRRPEVRGIAIGTPIRAGNLEDALGICVYVSQKVEEKFLPNSQILPKDIDGVRVDVVERAHRPLALSPVELRQRQAVPANRLQPGIAISLPEREMGTLGLMVRDQLRGNRLSVLSAAHVLEPRDGASREVLQPAWRNFGRRIGTVVSSIFDSDGDAAIAELEPNTAFRRAPIGLDAPTGTRRVQINEEVRKSGARTGTTSGVVHAVGEFTVDYGSGVELHMFGFEVRPLPGNTEEISEAGDSGAALIAASDNQAVGLLVADDRNGRANPEEYILACHLDLVFIRLGLKLA